MTDLVKCDRCGTPFSIQTAGNEILAQLGEE